MRKVVGLTVICSVGILAGCSSSISNPTPVSAQTSYSTASLDGTYSINLGGDIGESTSAFVGSFKTDGKGNVTSGNLTQYGVDNADVDNPSCTVTFTGTYGINNDATGTATLTVASSGADYCKLSGQLKFGLDAGQQGATVHFGESDGTGHLTGTATKQ